MKLIALLGNPIEHSLSPAMHNALFCHHQLDLEYAAIECSSTANMLGLLHWKDIIGYNITMPLKEKVVKHIDVLNPYAEKAQSVNTIVKRGSKLCGYNTDGYAAIKLLGEHVPLKGTRFGILGAGGLARSIAYALQSCRSDMIIFNRTIDKAVDLGEEIGCMGVGLKCLGYFDVDVYINATSVGMNNNETLLDPKVLKSSQVVFDTVYSPLQTRLLRDAKKAGCVTISGLEMLVEQGAKSFALWTGLEADKSIMRNAALLEVSKKK